MKRKIDVTLLGQRFSVRSERDEAYVHALAGFVGRRFEELKRVTRASSSHQLSLLVALNLADELFQAEERASLTREEIRKQTGSLVEKLARALAAAEAEAAALGEDDAELGAGLDDGFDDGLEDDVDNEGDVGHRQDEPEEPEEPEEPDEPDEPEDGGDDDVSPAHSLPPQMVTVQRSGLAPYR